MVHTEDLIKIGQYFIDINRHKAVVFSKMLAMKRY